MPKKTLVINPFEYKAEGLETMMPYIDALKNSFDPYVILADEELAAAEDRACRRDSLNGVTVVNTDSRKRGYLEVTADVVIDGGAVSGSSLLSAAQKRIAVNNGSLQSKIYDDSKPGNLLDVLDFTSGVYRTIEPGTPSSEETIRELISDAQEREIGDVIFLMEILNKDDEVHAEVLKLAKLFKNSFGAKIYAIGLMEFDLDADKVFFFDRDDSVDIKLSTENNPGTVRNILIETEGIVFICEKSAHHGYRNYVKDKTIVMTYDGAENRASSKFVFGDNDFGDPQKWRSVLIPLAQRESDMIAVRKSPDLWSRLRRRLEKAGSTEKRADTGQTTKREQETKAEAESMPLVSVVVPFYNDSATIKRAVSSICDNGYQNYEIILVNDGSGENPMLLLEGLGNIRYFYKENGGPGSARNLGIEKANGKYLVFLDSDDYLIEGSVTKLIEYAEEHCLDLVCGKTIRRYKDTGREEEWCGTLYRRTRVITRREKGELIDDTICHGRAYRLDFIKAAEIRFGDGLYEDNAFMSKIYERVGDVGIVADPVQKWLVYGNNTSRSTQNTFKNSKERLNVVDAIFSESSEFLRFYYTRQYIRHQIVAAVNGFINFDEGEKKALYEIIKKGLEMRSDYILDRLILLPSKKAFYKTVMKDDYDSFEQIAKAFSERYFDTIG